MTSMSSEGQLAREIRSIGTSGAADPGREVQSRINAALAGCDLTERLARLEGLARELEGRDAPPAGSAAPAAAAGNPGAAAEMQQLVSRFLGQSAAAEGLSSQELADKFAAALETLFDSVNQIVSVINVTLLGESQELETIRKVIGSNLKGDKEFSAIKEYLDRIQKAFLVAHNSFQGSAATLLGELLAELDPQVLLDTKSSGLKFGPLRRAELFDQYEEKHRRCRRWLDTGQYKERLLREFEKQCQIHFDANAR
jgi:hypothetical protein